MRTCTVILLLCAVASAQTYVVDRNSNNLRTINPATGGVLTTVPITGLGSWMQGVSVDPTTGILYGFDHGRQLATINPFSGVATVVGTMRADCADISFDSAGTLYGIGGNVFCGCFNATSVDFFSVNKSTGATTVLNALSNAGPSLGQTIAVSPFDGLIYRIQDGILWSIDPNNGFFLSFIANGVGGGHPRALAFGANGNLLLGDGAGQLWSVTTAGVDTLIGSPSFSASGIHEVGLFTAPPNYPGTGEDITAEFLLNGGGFVTAIDGSKDTWNLVPGDTFAIRHDSSGGTLDYLPTTIFGTLAPVGTPSFSPFAGIWLLTGGGFFEPIAGAFAGVPFVMVPPGITFGGVHVGGALTGISALIQAAVFSATAANGIFASPNGILVNFN